MKVRWNRDSLRLRITPAELSILVGGGIVTESLIISRKSVWSVAILPTFDTAET